MKKKRFKKYEKINVLISQPNYRNPLIYYHISDSIPKQDQLQNLSTESTNSSIRIKTRKIKDQDIIENQNTASEQVAIQSYTKNLGKQNIDQNITTNSDHRKECKFQHIIKNMRLNQIKQYSSTLTDTTVDTNTNNTDTLVFSDNSDNMRTISMKLSTLVVIQIVPQPI